MKATKKFKGMEDKELSFLKKKGATKEMVGHEAKEMKAEKKSEKPVEMSLGGMLKGHMFGRGRGMGGRGGMGKQLGEIMRGNSPDKAAAIRALMGGNKASPVNSDDFRGSTPKGTFKSALSMFKPGYKQSATSGVAPAVQPQKPNITAAGPNAPTSVMKKGGKVMKQGGCTKMATGGIAKANHAKGDLAGSKNFGRSTGEGIEKSYKADTKAVKHRQGDGCAQRGLTKIGRSKEM